MVKYQFQGAKNAVLPMLCASVMTSTNGSVDIEKYSAHLHDVTTTVQIAQIKWELVSHLMTK